MGRTSDARQRLMEAVTELVWTGSYGSTTIDSICEKADVKKGSFYYFFDSKTDLIVTAIQESWEKVYRPHMDSIFSPSLDPMERLKRHTDYMYQAQMEKYEQYGHVLGCPLFTLASEISTQEQELRELIDHLLTTRVRYLESALRDAAAKGQITCADPAFMAKTIFLYEEGALAEARIKNDITLLKQLWPSIQKILGVQTPDASRSKRKAA